MSFGYSIGDFIAGANLSYRLIQALSETRGASIEYQEAIAEISSLQQTFLQVSQMRASNNLSQATINMASLIVMSSMELIGDFLATTQKYRERLCGRRSGNNISDSWQKAGWMLFKKEQLTRLKEQLHLKLSHISLLLATAQVHGKIPASIAQYEVDSFDRPLPPTTQNRPVDFNDQAAEGSRHLKRQDSDLEKKLLAIEELMAAQKIHIEIAQKEIAARDAREVASKRKQEADALTSKRSTEERAVWEAKLEAERKKTEEKKAAWEKKFAEEKKAAQARGAESAKKQIDAERKKAEQKVADEKARSDAETAVADAKAMVERVQAEAHLAIQKAEKDAKEVVAKAELEAKDRLEKALSPLKQDKKKPIRFKDAVGRKFSFPFHLCATWAGMEELIKQAFLHVEVIGPHVQDGHYDLVGPNGEIILPQVWETMIEPDWSVAMHMWPMSGPQSKNLGPSCPPPPPEGWPPGKLPPSTVGPASFSFTRRPKAPIRSNEVNDVVMIEEHPPPPTSTRKSDWLQSGGLGTTKEATSPKVLFRASNAKKSPGYVPRTCVDPESTSQLARQSTNLTLAELGKDENVGAETPKNEDNFNYRDDGLRAKLSGARNTQRPRYRRPRRRGPKVLTETRVEEGHVVHDI